MPLIESARLRITPPEYANRAPYEGPLPKDGVSGLSGAKVDVFLRSNRPLAGGTLALWRRAPSGPAAGGKPAGRTPPPQAKPLAIPMKAGRARRPGSRRRSSRSPATGSSSAA